MWGDEGAFLVNARDAARGVAVLDVFGMGTYAEPASRRFQSWLISLLRREHHGWRLSSRWPRGWRDSVVFFGACYLGKRTRGLRWHLCGFAMGVTYARMVTTLRKASCPVAVSRLTWLAVRPTVAL